LDFRHVVLSHVFLDDGKNYQKTAGVYREFFKEGDEPACVRWWWIGFRRSHVEVTCIATTDLPRDVSFARRGF